MKFVALKLKHTDKLLEWDTAGIYVLENRRLSSAIIDFPILQAINEDGTITKTS